MRKVAIVFGIILLTAGRFAGTQGVKITGTVSNIEDKLGLPGVNILEKGTSNGAVTDLNGNFEIEVNNEKAILVFSAIGFVTHEEHVKNRTKINVVMQPDMTKLEEIVVIGYGSQAKKDRTGAINQSPGKRQQNSPMYLIAEQADYEVYDQYYPQQEFNTEGYATIHENDFRTASENPLSTFSIDVDVASYANMRRFLNNGQRPPVDAVRIEEMLNYFTYNYPQPEGSDPFSINTEIASCPWNENHKLVHIGLQGKKIPTRDLPPSNLVFLIDVSGSMDMSNKLPLVKSAFKMLVQELRDQDRVAIVVYAGAAGLVLPSTPGSNKALINQALDNLSAGGSTAGGAGIKLAYEIARNNFVKSGNNRVILATDGDFNVGASSNAEMERLIEQKREEGVFLSVVGFGMGNYKDDKMEIIADKGNGNYAYIDNLQEARKVFISEFGGTLFTIAKDVKIQVEFNPAIVQAYRLIGYENRKLNNEDFNDDKKDAGELGSGHTVTALYEIIPVGVESDFIKTIDPLKYQPTRDQKTTSFSGEMMTLKLRYKQPDGDVSKLISVAVKDKNNSWKNSSENFRWSAAVAEFGMLLRASKYAQEANYESVVNLAKSARGKDEEGYRSEFIRMVETSSFLAVRQ